MITLALVSAMLSGAPTPMTASLSPSSGNTIGFYVETTSVSQNTWVPISSDEEDILYIADSCGRQINAWIDSNNVPHLSYLATPEKGKISGYREIDNSFDSFLYMFNQFYGYVINDYQSSDPLNDICGYFRSFRSKYCSGLWNNFAGTPNSSFVSTVRNKYHDMLSFENYFNCILPGDNPNAAMHHSSSISLNVSDATETGRTIDLCHMFASIDLVEGRMYAQPNGSHNCNILEDLFTWAGDMQTEYQRLSGETEFDFSNYDFFSDSLMVGNSSFSFSDLLADIDSISIVLNYIRRGSNFQYAINDYYSVNTTFNSRKQRFTTTVIQHNRDQFPFTGYNVFKAKVYDFMRLKFNADYSITDPGDGNEYIRYLLLGNSRNTAMSNRINFAKSIISFFGGN